MFNKILSTLIAVLVGSGIAAIAFDVGERAALKAVLLWPNKDAESLVKAMTNDGMLADNLPTKFDRVRIKRMGASLKNEFDIKD